MHASESKAMRSSLSGSNGSGTTGAKGHSRSEATGANLAYLRGRTEDSPSRDSVSLQHKVGFLPFCKAPAWLSQLSLQRD